jgi:hypothetical protein
MKQITELLDFLWISEHENGNIKFKGRYAGFRKL